MKFVGRFTAVGRFPADEPDAASKSAATTLKITVRSRMTRVFSIFLLDDKSEAGLSEAEKNQRFWDRQW
jgi:hypothetical protein